MTGRACLLAMVPVLLFGCGARSPEGGVDDRRDAARELRESTRTVRIVDGLRDALERLLDPVEVRGLEAEVERIVMVADELEPGDTATFSLFAATDGGAASLGVEVRRDLRFSVRIHGEGAPFRAVREAVRSYWREALLEIEGDVEIAVREDPTPRGRPPVPKLTLATAREFGCQPYRIETDLARTAETLRLELLGISPPGGLCSPAFGPARGTVELDLAPGAYPLTIVRGGDEDRYDLVLTDSTLRLRPVRTTFTSADTRLRLRYPPRSFALQCGGTAGAALCGRLRSWIADREGISEHVFPSEGVVPYQRAPGAGGRAHFRYERAAALDPVRACFDRLDAVFAGVGAASMTVEFWTGERVRAPDPASGSGDAQGPEHGRGVAGGEREAAEGAAPCLPSVPPPAADSASVDRVERNRYLVGTARRLPCELRRMQARADSARAASLRRLRSGEDSTMHVPGAVSAPSSGDGERTAAAFPAVIPPNTSRSADGREDLHRELRGWLCAGGKEMADSATLGDADRHPGAAWYWVFHGGDWHYLLPGTTGGAVEKYLELVEEHGEELAWTADAGPDGGPRRVAVGPDQAVIPGFYLYRWRP